MAKESYELIPNNETTLETDDLTRTKTVGRRSLSLVTRLGIVFILVIFCTLFSIIVFRIYDEETDLQGSTVEHTQVEIGTTIEIPRLTTVPLPTIKATTQKTSTTVSTTSSIANSTTNAVNQSTTSSISVIPTPALTTITPSNRTKRSAQNADSKPAEAGLSPLFRKSPKVCTTLACKTTASRMLSLMQESVEPCEDFYGFTCGGTKEEVSDTEDVWTRISDQLFIVNSSSPAFLQKYKTFYDSCVIHERLFNYQNRIATVSNLIKEVGTIVSEAEEAQVDLVKLFSKLFLRRSIPFLDLDIGFEDKARSFLLKLSPANKISVLKETGQWLELSDDKIRCLSEQKKNLQAKDIDLNKIHSAYVECQKKPRVYLNSIGSVVRALGLLTGDKTSQEQQTEDIKKTIENAFMNHLNVVPTTNTQREKYEIQKISKLQETYQFIQWKALVEALTGHVVDEATSIQIYSTEYFVKVLGALQAIPKWKINNALIAIHAVELYENLVIPQAKHAREDYCIQLGAKLFPDTTSYIYFKTWPEAETEQYRKLIIKIYSQLKSKLTDSIEKAEWADATSKTSMLSKLKNQIKLLVNTNEDICNDARILQQKYENVVLNSSNFIQNTVTMLEISKKSVYDLQGKAYDDKYLWSNFVNAFDTYPTSFYANGLIVVPIGVITHPIKEEYPGYLTMAQLGLSIAKELGRQFDLLGIEHGITLSETSRQLFTKFKDSMENSASFTGSTTLKNHKLKFQADPKLSSNERIVENAAVRMISDSMNSLGEESLLPWISTSYNIEKVFFIAIAQGYCKNIDIPEFMNDIFESELLPPFLRVRNIITNSAAFQKVFECSNESAMNKNSVKLQFPFI